jgi:carboxyl-terminal processing protease
MDPTWPERPATEPTTPSAETDGPNPAEPDSGSTAADGSVPTEAVPAPAVQSASPWPGIAPAEAPRDVPAGSNWELVKPRRRARLPLSIAIVTVMVVTFFAGVAVDRSAMGVTSPPASGVATGNASEPPEFKTFWEAWDVLHQHYVDQTALDPSKLTYGAINGMVDAVGDTGHTRFLTPAEVTASHQNLSGSITGIGARMSQVGSNFVIQSVVPGSPAEKAGLRGGDTVLQVDGTSVAGQTLDEVVGSIRGDAGTTVKLQIGRPGQDAFDVSIVRANVSVPAVSWAMVPGTKTALIRIEEFSQGATDDLKKALAAADKAGATSVVLDLRDNPGGFVNEAIGVASAFMKDGVVYQDRDAQGKVTPHPVNGSDYTTDKPLAVLVNLGSASASEIVAGALQDSGRAKVYGATTFGTGTVLSEFDLSDGSALLVGTLEWLTPSGRQIWHEGITPNVPVALPTGSTLVTPDQITSGGASAVTKADDSQLDAAVKALGS